MVGTRKRIIQIMEPQQPRNRVSKRPATLPAMRQVNLFNGKRLCSMYCASPKYLVFFSLSCTPSTGMGANAQWNMQYQQPQQPPQPQQPAWGGPAAAPPAAVAPSSQNSAAATAASAAGATAKNAGKGTGNGTGHSLKRFCNKELVALSLSCH